MEKLGKIAAKGEGGDSLLGHLSRGDTVVPVEKITPQVHGLLAAILGGQLARFTAGNPANRKNAKTGLPEFEGEGEGGDSGGPGEGGGPGQGVGANDSADTADTGGSTGGGTKSSTAAEENSALSDTSLANNISNTAQSGLTAVSAMMAGVNKPDWAGAAKAAALGLLSGGPLGAAVGAFTGAAGPGMPSLGGSALGALTDHGIDNGTNPGGTGDPAGNGAGNGQDSADRAAAATAQKAGLISALNNPAPIAPAPQAPANPLLGIGSPASPFWWQRALAARRF